MKKFLCVLLSVIMLISVCAGIDFSAMAVETKDTGKLMDSVQLMDEESDGSDLLDESSAPTGYELDNSDSVFYSNTLKAAAATTTASGTCGNSLNWTLSSDGELVISGTGEMSTFAGSTSAPWYSKASSIKTVKINSGVTSISQYAFCRLTNLTSITIPSTVTVIGKMAFALCSSLTSVTLPSTVKEIPYALFGDCTKLTSVTASGVTTIGDYAFQNTALTTYKIGKNVSSISGLAFFGATKIASFTVESTNTTFTAVSGVLYTDSGKTLFAYPQGKTTTSFTIPSTVTKVGKAAFAKVTRLQSVTIPSSVTTLEESAFQESGLTSVKIPDSVTTAGNFTFYKSNVKTVTFGKGLTVTSYQMFEECANLTTINFPSTNLELFARTFTSCSSLTTVNLPNTVTKIGNACFADCNALTTVTTNGVKEIPFQAFLNCTALANVTLNNIEKVLRVAFYGCSSLKSITLPASTQYVHNIAFPTATNITCKNTELRKFGYNGLARLQDISITGNVGYTQAYQVLDLVNSQRAANGLSALVMDETLLDLAMTRASEIAVCYTHTRPDGSTVFEMNSKINAENIAAGYNSASSVMTGWMNSQGHRANILTSNFKTIGIGCFRIEGVYYWVQVFGTDSNTSSFTKPTDKSVSKTVTVAVDEFSEGTISTGNIYSAPEQYKIDFILNLSSASIKNTETSQASVSVKNPGTNYSIKINNTGCNWSSSDKTVATVSSAGLVKGIHEGSSNIVLKLGLISLSKAIKVTGHTAVIDKAVAPTCTKTGLTEGSHCSVCGAIIKAQTTVNKIAHKYDEGKTIKAATATEEGTKTYTCTVCGETKTEAIAKISNAELSYTTVNYSGNARKPVVTVKNSAGETLSDGVDYTVTYESGRVNVGRYAVKVAYKGDYSGSETLYFNIVPKGTSISTMTAKADGFTVQWNTQKTQTTGYQVQYSTSSNFSNATTITMPKNTYYAKSVAGLTKNKKYYVRVRTYSVVKFNGKDYNLYSSWSGVKTVSTVTTTPTLSYTTVGYSGSARKPTVTVKDSAGKTLKNGTDYIVSYESGRKNVGRYAVKISYKGNYAYNPAQTLYFNITPKGTTVSKVTAKSKGLTVQWNTQKTQTTGYQVQYSTASNFSGAKTITMSKPDYYAKTITGLTGNKKYYVRVRTYKVVKFNGKDYNIYSGWSAAKSVTTNN